MKEYEMNVTIGGTVTIRAETQEEAGAIAYARAIQLLARTKVAICENWDNDNIMVEPND